MVTSCEDETFSLSFSRNFLRRLSIEKQHKIANGAELFVVRIVLEVLQ